jgi:hypothetical protein
LADKKEIRDRWSRLCKPATAGRIFSTLSKTARKFCGFFAVCRSEQTIEKVIDSRTSASNRRQRMWCKNCRQDIPGVLSQNDKQFCCMRCGQLLGATADTSGTLANARSSIAAESQTSVSPRTLYDPWEVNEKLRHAERILQLGHRPGPGLDETLRFDPMMPVAPTSNTPSPTPRRRHPIAIGIAWLLTAVGTSGLSCGALLTVWGWLGQRTELWNLGLPIMVVGQMVLLAGLLVHFGRGSAPRATASEAPQAPPVFNQFPAAQQYRVDGSDIYGARPSARGRNAPPPRA